MLFCFRSVFSSKNCTFLCGTHNANTNTIHVMYIIVFAQHIDSINNFCRKSVTNRYCSSICMVVLHFCIDCFHLSIFFFDYFHWTLSIQFFSVSYILFRIFFGLFRFTLIVVIINWSLQNVVFLLLIDNFPTPVIKHWNSKYKITEKKREKNCNVQIQLWKKLTEFLLLDRCL